MDYSDPVRALIPGVQGAVLSVLARTDAPLTVLQLAERAGASRNRVASVVARLEQLGVVDRRSVGAADQIVMTGSAASSLLRSLADLRDLVLDGLRELAERLDPKPLSVTVFGSFARGTAVADSDVDVLVVRPAGLREDDEAWNVAVGRFVDDAAQLLGNPVAEIEFAEEELPEVARRRLYREIVDHGLVLAGKRLEDVIDGA